NKKIHKTPCSENSGRFAAERGSGQKRPYGHAGRARSRSIFGRLSIDSSNRAFCADSKVVSPRRRSAISYVTLLPHAVRPCPTGYSQPANCTEHVTLRFSILGLMTHPQRRYA